jgi:hypothetical protein
MTTGDVYDRDMEDTPDFDDPALADLLSDVRTVYRSVPPAVSAALAAQFAVGARPNRSTWMRRRLAQLVTATTVVAAATGGLAVAGALPAPVQNVVSNAADDIGVDVPQGDQLTTPATEAEEPTSTTTVEEPTTTPTTVDDQQADGSDDETDATDEKDATGDQDEGDDAADENDAADDASTHPDNHGKEVSAVAHDKTRHGCEHGRAVSAVASGKVKDKPCPHTEDGATTPTTVAENPQTTPPAPLTAPSPNSHGHGNGRGNGHAKSKPHKNH